MDFVEMVVLGRALRSTLCDNVLDHYIEKYRKVREY